jgi:heme/copper-type cytochrome/quinol oxidase subunit 2
MYYFINKVISDHILINWWQFSPRFQDKCVDFALESCHGVIFLAASYFIIFANQRYLVIFFALNHVIHKWHHHPHVSHWPYCHFLSLGITTKKKINCANPMKISATNCSHFRGFYKKQEPSSFRIRLIVYSWEKCLKNRKHHENCSLCWEGSWEFGDVTVNVHEFQWTWQYNYKSLIFLAQWKYQPRNAILWSLP